jgi:hypothetical protein
MYKAVTAILAVVVAVDLFAYLLTVLRLVRIIPSKWRPKLMLFDHVHIFLHAGTIAACIFALSYFEAQTDSLLTCPIWASHSTPSMKPGE